MALAPVGSAVVGDRGDLLFGRNPVRHLGQIPHVPDILRNEVVGANFQCLLVDNDVDLVSEAPLRTTMLARLPLALNFKHDTGAVDQLMQGPREPRLA
ncbi:hypothetical protein EU800_22150 [Tropicimonas sp. IMCC6043]|nr:hypothetical protein EU800_22150 [Tropicimonas sp. IMCC6043]